MLEVEPTGQRGYMATRSGRYGRAHIVSPDHRQQGDTMFAKVNCYTPRRPTYPVLSIFVGPSSSALPVASPGMGRWGTCCPWSLMHAVFFLLPGAFCGLKYAENAIAAGALPGTRWGSSRRSPRPPSRLGSGHPSTYPTHSAPRCSRLRRLDRRAPPDTKSWRRHCALLANTCSVLTPQSCRRSNRKLEIYF